MGRGRAHEGFIFLSLSCYPGDLNVQPGLRITDLRRVSVSKRFHQIKKKKKTRYYLFPILPRDPETGKRNHREKSRERTAVKKAVGQGVFLSAPRHYFFLESYHGIYHYHYN